MPFFQDEDQLRWIKIIVRSMSAEAFDAFMAYVRFCRGISEFIRVAAMNILRRLRQTDPIIIAVGTGIACLVLASDEIVICTMIAEVAPGVALLAITAAIIYLLYKAGQWIYNYNPRILAPPVHLNQYGNGHNGIPRMRLPVPAIPNLPARLVIPAAAIQALPSPVAGPPLLLPAPVVPAAATIQALPPPVAAPPRRPGILEPAVSVSRADLDIFTGGILNVIGRGSYGPVYSGTWDGERVAVKMKEAEGDNASFPRELRALENLRHCNLMQLYGFCRETSSFVFPCMHNDLRAALDHDVPLLATKRLLIAADVATGLAYLHSPGPGHLEPYFHRDIKAANILLDHHQRAVIADFGLAKPQQYSGGSRISGECGTKGYVCPDYVRSCEFKTSSDVFSFGVVLLELLSGQHAVVAARRPPSLSMWASVEIEAGRARNLLDRQAGWDMLAEDKSANLIGVARNCIRDSTRRISADEVSERLCSNLPSWLRFHL